MNEIKKDRRIKKTRVAARNAFAELLTQKSFNEIKVKEIAELANINRGTFYLHYKDIYDLLAKTEDEFISEFENVICNFQIGLGIRPKTDDEISINGVIESLYDYMNENVKMLRALILNNAPSRFLDKLCAALIAKINEGHISGCELKNEYLHYFLIYGMTGVVKKWFEDGCRLTKAEFADILNAMIYSVANSEGIPKRRG